MPTGVYKRTKWHKRIQRESCRTKENRERARRSAIRSWRNPRYKSKFLKSKRNVRFKKKISEIIKRTWLNPKRRKSVFFTRLLWRILEPIGYEKEVSVCCGIGKKGKKYYKIDFALRENKIAIESDGPNHRGGKEYRKRDRKKSKLLHSLGWKVIRVLHD